MYGFHQLAQSDRARAGHIVVSNFGAGTANTEFDVLTGIQTNMVSEGNVSSFRVLHKSVNALPWAYRRAGYATYFTHPGYSWFYNRDNVYQYLGVEERVFNEALYRRRQERHHDFRRGVPEASHRRSGYPPEHRDAAVCLRRHHSESSGLPLQQIRLRAGAAAAAYDDFRRLHGDAFGVSRGRAGLHRHAHAAVRSISMPGRSRCCWCSTATTAPRWGRITPSTGSWACTPARPATAEDVLATYETPYLLWANKAYAPYADFDALGFWTLSAPTISARRSMSSPA